MDVDQELIPGLPDDVEFECLQRLDYGQRSVFASVSRRWKEELHSPYFLHRRRVAGLTQSFLALVVEENQQYHGIPQLVAYIAVYDLKSYRWLRSSPMPNYPQNYRLRSHRLLQAGHRILVICSPRYFRIIHIYDMLAGTWRLGAPNPFPNWHMPAFASDGVSQVFLAGGHEESERDWKALSTAALYDVDRDTWRRLPDMVKTRVACDGYFHNGIFYVIGSHIAGDNPTDDDCRGERYDVSTGVWSLETEVETDACFLSPDGKYYKLVRDGHRTKLMVKLGGRCWAFVGYLPGEICRFDDWLPFAFEGGFVMIKLLKENPTFLYMFSLSGDDYGDDYRNITCQKVSIPCDYRGALIYACSLKV